MYYLLYKLIILSKIKIFLTINDLKKKKSYNYGTKTPIQLLKILFSNLTYSVDTRFRKDYPTSPYYNVTYVFGDPSIMIALKSVSIGNPKQLTAGPQFVNCWDITLDSHFRFYI